MNELCQDGESAAPVINRLHAEICDAARTTIDKAIRIGQLLTEQKARLKHGQWLPWLETNVEFSRQTADNYRRIYDRREELKSLNIGNLTDAYAATLPEKAAENSPKITRTEAEEFTEELARKLEFEVVPALVRLGIFLSRVRDEKLYKDWGARSFYEYRRSIDIRPEVVEIAVDFCEAIGAAADDDDAFMRAWDDHKMRFVRAADAYAESEAETK